MIDNLKVIIKSHWWIKNKSILKGFLPLKNVFKENSLLKVVHYKSEQKENHDAILILLAPIKDDKMDILFHFSFPRNFKQLSLTRK